MLDGRYDDVTGGGNLESYLGTNLVVRISSDRIKYIAYRHNHKLNVLFIDTHVQIIKSSGQYLAGGFMPGGVRFYNTPGIVY